MRTSCLDCARKHLAQAEVLMAEALKGYPEHAWLAVGHLAEAEDELLDQHPELALGIRADRVKYIDAINKGEIYFFPTVEFIRALTNTAEEKRENG